MHMNTLLTAAALAISALSAGSVMAQAKPETLVKQRTAAMALQGKYFYQIRAMAQGKVPYDAATVARNAVFLDALSKMPWDGFNANTKDLRTGATAAVYTETAKFKEAEDRLIAESAKLAALTKGADEAAIKAQILAVDKTCNGCHEGFRERQ